MTKKSREELYDKRIFKKNIDRGLLAERDYADFVKSLPDESKNAEVLKVFAEEKPLTFSSVEYVKV